MLEHASAITFVFLFQELLKWAGKEVVNDGSAPAGGESQIGEVPEPGTMRIASEALSDPKIPNLGCD
jgi:hypothetical protein